MRIQTVITAAGDSRSQFLDAGFLLPKSLIKVGTKQVIEMAIDSYVIDYSNFQVAVNSEESTEFGTDRAGLISFGAFSKGIERSSRCLGFSVIVLN